jgi:hypothetical protein
MEVRTSHTSPAVCLNPNVIIDKLINIWNVPPYILMVVSTAMGHVTILIATVSNPVCELCLSSYNRKYSRVKRKSDSLYHIPKIKNKPVCHAENMSPKLIHCHSERFSLTFYILSIAMIIKLIVYYT